jgi:hypothetical protein
MIRRTHWVLIVVVGIAFCAVAWAGLTPLQPEMREEVHVIPQGTWARRMKGEDIEVLPSRIDLKMSVRDILVLINNDDVPQQFGPVLMMPGQSFRLPFNVASEYQFTCTAHVSGFLTVVVSPPPSWWDLLVLRAASNTRRAAAMWSLRPEQA